MLSFDAGGNKQLHPCEQTNTRENITLHHVLDAGGKKQLHPCEQTNTGENITLPHVSDAGANKQLRQRLARINIKEENPGKLSRSCEQKFVRA